jgi:outer membrane protein assembly factor BamB
MYFYIKIILKFAPPGTLYNLNPSTGATIWTATFGASSGSASASAVVRDDGAIWTVSRTTGALVLFSQAGIPLGTISGLVPPSSACTPALSHASHGSMYIGDILGVVRHVVFEPIVFIDAPLGGYVVHERAGSLDVIVRNGDQSTDMVALSTSFTVDLVVTAGTAQPGGVDFLNSSRQGTVERFTVTVGALQKSALVRLPITRDSVFPEANETFSLHLENLVQTAGSKSAFLADSEPFNTTLVTIVDSVPDVFPPAHLSAWPRAGRDNQRHAAQSSTPPTTLYPPWNYKFPGPPMIFQSGAAIALGLIFIGMTGPGGGLYAIREDGGGYAWSILLNKAVWGDIALSADEELVFFGALSGKLYGVNTTSQAIQWQAVVAGGADHVFGVSLYNGTVIAGHDVTLGTSLTCLDERTGDVRWSYINVGTADRVSHTPLIAYDGSVVASDDGGAVFRFVPSIFFSFFTILFPPVSSPFISHAFFLHSHAHAPRANIYIYTTDSTRRPVNCCGRLCRLLWRHLPPLRVTAE